MTKKDYERAVTMIGRAVKYNNLGAVFVSTADEAEYLANIFCEFFEGDNRNFDPERFRKAVHQETEAYY